MYYDEYVRYFKLFIIGFVGFFALGLAKTASAHEQYVLTKHQLDVGFADTSLHVIDALKNPANLTLTIVISLGIVVVLISYFFFQYSKSGLLFDSKLQKWENIGHVLVRISLGFSLLASAYFGSFLGPEIPASSLHLGVLIVPLLSILGVLFITGFLIRFASILGFLVLLAATVFYGEYMITYFNYYGEYLALIIFGSYFFSLDNIFFGASKIIKRYKDWEILALRITYGISVLYPAITIKLMHPLVIVEIYNKFHMGKIWWLFPQDPLLTSLGTGLAQILVGVFIILGFQTRLASLITFLLYLGSIIFFQESVWPHIVLLALAFYFVINNGGKFTTDNFIFIKFFKEHKKK